MNRVAELTKIQKEVGGLIYSRAYMHNLVSIMWYPITLAHTLMRDHLPLDQEGVTPNYLVILYRIRGKRAHRY